MVRGERWVPSYHSPLATHLVQRLYGRTGLGKVRPRQFGDPGKGVRVVDRNVGQSLAVELDLGALQAVNQLAVANSAHAACRVDANDPETPEQALAHAPVAKGIHTAADQGNRRLSDEIVPAEAKPLGQPAQTFAASKDRFTAACSWHGPYP